eukprot:1155395-Pelagomonas_calceolata.AAC.2
MQSQGHQTIILPGHCKALRLGWHSPEEEAYLAHGHREDQHIPGSMSERQEEGTDEHDDEELPEAGECPFTVLVPESCCLATLSNQDLKLKTGHSSPQPDSCAMEILACKVFPNTKSPFRPPLIPCKH